MFWLSWTIGVGAVNGGGNKYEATLDDVLEILKEVLQKSGTVTVEIIDAPDIGPQSLQVFAQRGEFILFLLEHDEDDSSIRTYTNPLNHSGRTEILGDFWDSNSICTDPSIVVNAFRDFYNTGDLPKELLS